MSEEFGPDFISVTDEDGNEFELELVDTLEHNGVTYFALFPAVGEDEETGDVVEYVPAKSICVTAPGAGRTLYGCVTQAEMGKEELVSHMGRRIPRHWTDKKGRELRLASKPLLIPRRKNPFISAEVL